MGAKKAAGGVESVPLGKYTYTGSSGTYENKIEPGNFHGVRWSPDGKRFLILDSNIWVFADAGKGFKYAFHVGGEMTEDRSMRNLPSDAVFSADGRSLFVGFQGANQHYDRSGIARLDVETGKETARVTLAEHNVQGIAVHPGGELFGVVTGRFAPNKPSTFLVGLDGRRTALGGPERAIAFEPKGELVVAICDDAARAFDLTGKPVSHHAGSGDISGWLPDGRVVLDGGDFMDLRTGRVESITLPEADGVVCNWFVDPAGGYVGAALAEPGHVVCWDFKGKVLADVPIVPGKSGTGAMVATDGRILFAENWQRKVFIHPPIGAGSAAAGSATGKKSRKS